MTTQYKLKRLREIHNLTLEAVGKMVGVGKSTVRKWETGDIANMRRDKIESLSSLYSIDANYLISDIDYAICPKCGMKYYPTDDISFEKHETHHLKWLNELHKDEVVVNIDLDDSENIKNISLISRYFSNMTFMKYIEKLWKLPESMQKEIYQYIDFKTEIANKE